MGEGEGGFLHAGNGEVMWKSEFGGGGEKVEVGVEVGEKDDDGGNCGGRVAVGAAGGGGDDGDRRVENAAPAALVGVST